MSQPGPTAPDQSRLTTLQLKHFSQWRTLRDGRVVHGDAIQTDDVTPDAFAATLELYVSNSSKIFTYPSGQRRELIEVLAEELSVSTTLFRDIASWWEDSGRKVSE